jgi:hypothetical protein
VHLGDRGGGQGPTVEVGEHLVDRAAQLGGQRLLDLLPRGRGDVVLELLQLLDELHREQIWAGGQHLAELDEGDPALVERPPHRPGQPHPAPRCVQLPRRRPCRYGPRPWRIAILLIWEYRRARAIRPRSSRRHSSGPGTDPLGTNASATTRNTIATTSAPAPVRMKNHTGVTAWPVAGNDPETERAIGPTTANARRPATSSRTIPNRSPNSRRASTANPPTIPTTLSTMRTAVRAMASSLSGDSSSRGQTRGSEDSR